MNDVQKRITELAANLGAYDISALERKSDLGRLSFEDSLPVFRRACGFAAIWTQQDLVSELSAQEQADVTRFLEGLHNAFNSIRAYDPAQTQNAASERIQRVDAVRRLLDEFSNSRCSVLLAAFAARQHLEKQNQIDDLKKQAAALIQEQILELGKPLAEARVAVEQIRKLKDDADAAMASVRALTATESLQKYSSFYGDEATRSKRAAIGWGGATALLAIFLLCYLIWLTFWWSEAHLHKEVLAAVQAGAAKIALFSVAFYITAWCGRNFRSQWHLFVVNRHRANTLNALDAFANSAKESSTREGILLHASSAIFSHGNTGFLPDVGDVPSSPSVLEIVRAGKG